MWRRMHGILVHHGTAKLLPVLFIDKITIEIIFFPESMLHKTIISIIVFPAGIAIFSEKRKKIITFFFWGMDTRYNRSKWKKYFFFGIHEDCKILAVNCTHFSSLLTSLLAYCSLCLSLNHPCFCNIYLI